MRTTIMAVMAALGLAGAAHATEEIVTVTGTVTSGFDPMGVFGPKGADLTGAAFTATIGYNLADGGTNTPFAGYNEEIFSGDVASTVDYFNFSINGLSDGFRRGPIFGDFVATEYTGANVYRAQVDRDQNQGFMVYVTDLPSQAYVNQPFAVSGGSNLGTGYGDNEDGLGLYLTPETITLTESNAVFPSPVPEPASWTIMLVGFGLAGVSLRRHRSLHRLV